MSQVDAVKENALEPVVENVEAPVVDNVEAPVVEEPKKATKEELFSSKFANLTRKERELQIKEKEVKAQYAQIEQLNSIKSDSKAKINEALELVGLTLDDIIDYQLSNLEKDYEETDDSIEGKYKRIEKKLSAIEQKEADSIKFKQDEAEKSERIANDETILEFKKSLTAFIEEKPETYELIAAQEAQDTVFEVIEEHFNSSGNVMSFEDAANLVENYLEDEAKNILSKSKKLQKYLPQEVTPVQVTEELKESPIKQPKKVVAPTLAQEMVSAANVKVKSQYISKDERLKRATEQLKWIK